MVLEQLFNFFDQIFYINDTSGLNTWILLFEADFKQDE